MRYTWESSLAERTGNWTRLPRFDGLGTATVLSEIPLNSKAHSSQCPQVLQQSISLGLAETGAVRVSLVGIAGLRRIEQKGAIDLAS